MTSFVLLVITVVHFLVGVFGQNLSCEVLTRLGTGEEPQQRELYDFIDRNIPLTALNPHGVVKDDLVTVSNIVKYVCKPPQELRVPLLSGRGVTLRPEEHDKK